MSRFVAGGFDPDTLAAQLGGGGGGGSIIGPNSILSGLATDISGVTSPNLGTLGSFIDTLDFPDAAETGQKYEFKVPDDYDSGDLTINLTYAMSSAVASPNNVVRLELGIEIAPPGGAVATLLALTGQDETTPENTDVVRSAVLTITEGTFAAGDFLLILVKRLGAHGNDLHTGDLQLIAVDLAYTAQVATREAIQVIENSVDTDEPAPTPVTVSNFDVLEFSPTVDNEQKFVAAVPDNYDGLSEMQLRVTYAMAAAASGNVILETDVEIANTMSGAIIAQGVVRYTLVATPDTDVHQSVAILSLPPSVLNPGDAVVIKLARRGSDPDDTHGSGWRLFVATLETGVGPSTPVTGLDVLPAEYIAGLLYEVVNTNDVRVAPGVARDDSDSDDLRLTSDAVASIDVGESAGLTAPNGLDEKVIGGTASASGTNYTGVGTAFLTDFQPRGIAGESTAAGPAITGTNTRYLRDCAVGDLFGNSVSGYIRIASIASDTALTLAASLPGPGLVSAAVNVIENATIEFSVDSVKRVISITSDTVLQTDTSGTGASQTMKIGVELPDTFYYLWLVKGSGGVASFLSTQRTELLNPPPTHAVVSRRIGVVRNNGSGDLRTDYAQLWGRGTRLIILGDGAVSVLANAVPTAGADLDLSPAVPPTAEHAYLAMSINPNAVASEAIAIWPKLSGLPTLGLWLRQRSGEGATGSDIGQGQGFVPSGRGVSAARYSISDAGGAVARGDVWVSGFIDRV